MNKIPMTHLGFKRLECELKNLKSIKRPSIINAIASARALGDLSENAEYQAAREKQGFIEGRIAELENKLSRANVIDVSKITGKTVKFGAIVSILDEKINLETTYQIVGEDEADMKKKQLSLSAPLSRALIGKKVGEVVEFNSPGGCKSYKIISIIYK